MSEKNLIHLTIDNQSVQVPEGTLIIEAARQLGIRIPHYCFHGGLSCVGSCRMCLVEIEKNPKLQPSCATAVTEGMVVHTETPATLENRRFVLEFLLANHPLDCPVCDQAGECELQNYYMAHGRYDARYDDNKTKRKKAYTIGPRIILDQERCILCTRCVRFTQEISRTFELGVIDRGHRSFIDIFPGKELDNRYSGNIADVCPVGAMTDRDFRFKCRVWFLGSADSVCPGCSRGCNIKIQYNARFNPRYHTDRIQRLKPRYNKDVNGHWICDDGRYAYPAIDADTRLQNLSAGTQDDPGEPSWPDTIREVAAAIKETHAKHGPGGMAVLASPQMTNEELYGIRQLFHDKFKIENIEFRIPSGADSYADDILINADKNPNSKGAEMLLPSGPGIDTLLQECADGNIHLLYIFHQDLTAGHDPEFVRTALGKVSQIIYQGSWENRTAELATIKLPAAVYAEKEGTFTNFQGRVQKINAAVEPLGQSLPDLDILTRLAAELEAPVKDNPDAVFDDIAGNIEPFSEITYSSIGNSGQMLKQEAGE